MTPTQVSMYIVTNKMNDETNDNWKQILQRI